ncbi:YeeE/YedE family protein [Leptolyngbya sp. FACHB-321]|uniref:YeeE/YedE thiosulfate transporter family protein n=1 Tax=Leptolyngbya sp. FACHB-321 TaxID=2692807 RepID=UPI001688F7D3|nr:YeeE/YedE family protein [Leptolyngbya sp. FACHB-321]
MIQTDSFTTPLRSQRLIVAIALSLFTAGAIALTPYGWKQSALFLIGGLLGMTLYHASFGFASAYRKLLVDCDVRGMYAQLVMLAIATLLFAPVLANGSVFDQSVRGAISPVGVQGAIGAFLFGIGMQLGGACGCGTLYTLGGGSLPMVITLITFCIGAFWASLTRQLWAGLPATPPIALGTSIGWVGAVVLQLVVFMLLAGVLRWWSNRRQEAPSSEQTKSAQPFSLLRGPWSLVTGAIVLAVLNWLTLILSGQPWRVTWGFALWSAEVASSLGWDSTTSPFWSSEAAQQSLSRGVFADVSSVMNMGIVLGALSAAALAGRLLFKFQLSRLSLVATLIGGLVMGYGAFLAYGCNVSAFFGGIASTSLHGWVWILCALVGTAVGLRLRPLFHY